MAGIASLSSTARDMFRGPRGVAGFIPHLKDGGEATYRSPLFGPKVDRYIPPEVRQILGAAVAGADMLNPVSAYREYLKAVNEEDYTDAAVEAAGILAPGVAGKLVKPAVRVAGPYVDDATKAMMEVFLPTGAPDVAPRMVGGVDDFGRGLGSESSGRSLEIRPSSENIDDVIDASAKVGLKGQAGFASVNDLRGGVDLTDVDQKKRVDRLVDQMSGPDGYFERIIIDGQGNVVEGQHRLEAARRLNMERIPVVQILAVENHIDEQSAVDAIRSSFGGNLREEQAREVLRNVAEDVMSGHAEKYGAKDVPEEWVGPYNAALEYVKNINVFPIEKSSDQFLPLQDPRAAVRDPDLDRGLGSVGMPAAEASQRTQIAGTFPTYEKAVRVFDEVAPEGRSLDYGAGLGKSSELGFDTFEPFAREGFDPTYRVSSDIPDASYERVTNLNVLNVLDPETRRGVVLDIGRVLKPDGVAVITTRGRDVLTAKGERGPEDMSVITTAGTYQKGFTKPELVSYLRDTLGEGFEVKSLNLGPAGALVRKLPVDRPD